MRDIKLTTSEQAVFDLIRVALWNHSPQMDYGSLSKETWTKIYRLSVNHGVCGIVFDGICQLNISDQPPADLFITWAANTKLAEMRYKKINEIVDQLSQALNAEGIQMLLLKGRTIAECYPIPAHREYGDIDIFLGNDFEKGRLFFQHHATFDHANDKHEVYNYNGCVVENHRSLIDTIASNDILITHRLRCFDQVERELRSILNTEAKECLPQTQVCIPSATFNFIFLLVHSSMHLSNGLVIRYLCDWARFLYCHKGKYDETKIKKVLRLLNFRKFSDLLTYMAIHYIGMPKDYAPSYYSGEIDQGVVFRLIQSLFYPFPSAKEVKNNTLLCKWKRFRSKQWKYSLFYKEYLLERFIHTLIIWISKRRNNNI